MRNKSISIKNKRLLTTAIMALVASIALSFACYKSVPKVSADGELCSSFAVSEEASVRYGTDELGIRYEITLSKADYDYMKTNYNDAEYGIFVAPIDYVSENALTEENLIGANAKYDWAEKNNGIWTYTASDKKRVAKYATKYLKETENGDFHFYGVLNNVKNGTENETNNLVREFCAVGYVKYQEGEQTKYIITEKSTVTSLAYLAQKEIAEYEKTIEEISAITENNRTAAQKATMAEATARKKVLNDKVIDNVGKSTTGANTTKVVPSFTYETEYYFEKKTGIFELEEDKTETKSAEFNTTVNADVKAFSGYHENAEEKGAVKSGKVLANGKLTLKVYYSSDIVLRLREAHTELNGNVDLTKCELYDTLSEKVYAEAEITAKVSFYGMDIAVENDSFEVKSAGKYEITYTSNYGGFEYSLTETFEKSYEKQANEINSFDKIELKDKIFVQEGVGTVSWKSDLNKDGEAKYGIAEIDYKNQNAEIRFDMPMALTKFEEAGYDLIGITIASEKSFWRLDYPTSNEREPIILDAVKAKTGWTTYLIPLQKVKGGFDENGCSINNKWFCFYGSEKVHMYIADISMYKSSELISLSSETTAETITIASAEGIADLKVFESEGNKSEVTLNNGKFYTSQSAFLVSFEKEGSNYVLVKKFNIKAASEVTTIGFTTSDELKVKNEITLKLSGVSYFGGDNKPAINGNVKLLDPQGKDVSGVTYTNNNVQNTIKFTPTIAGVYKIQIESAYNSFSGKKLLEFYVYDKELTVSGEATLSGTTMTLPTPILKGISDNTSYNFELVSIAVVIGTEEFTSDAYTVEVSKFGNYTATYEVDKGGIKYKCTLSGVVSDGNILVVENAQSTIYITDGQLTLPEPKLKDADGNELSYANKSVILSKGDANISLTGMSFVAEVGLYKAVYNVDYSGNTYSFEYEFYVEPPRVNTFDSNVNNIEFRRDSLTDGSTMTWLAEKTIGGVTKYGVADLNFKANGDNKYFMFDLNSSLENVKKYDYIGLEVYSTHGINNIDIDVSYTNDDRINIGDRITFANRWVTLIIPVMMIEDNYNTDGTAKTGERNLFRILNNNTGALYHLYIADISLYRAEDLISFSTDTTGSNVTLTLANGVDNLTILESQGNNKNVTTTPGYFSDNTYFVNQSKYIVNFTKQNTNYSIIKAFKGIEAEKITTISYTPTNGFKVGSEITMNIVGVHYQGDNKSLATQSNVKLYSVDSTGKETQITKQDNKDVVVWSSDKPSIRFTPSAAGTYRIKINSAYDSFVGTKVLEFVVNG